MVETLNANVPLEKTRIVSVLKQKGPSVANTIAKALELPNILTSAILSEMTGDKTLKASNLKIGGSPLYYIPGQELVLENFISHLQNKEREAFAKLKEAGLLVDSELEPAIRVALRNIKDFATALKVNVNNEERIVWKYFMLKKEDAELRLDDLFEIKKQEKKEVKSDNQAVKEIKRVEKQEKAEAKPESKGKPLTNPLEGKAEAKPELEKKPKEKKIKTDIRGMAEKWLSKTNGELKSEIMIKNKEASFLISASSGIGKLDFLLIVKDKKAVNEADLAMAYKEGMNQKLPVIVLFKGKPSKKLLEYAESFGGHLLLREIGNF